MKNCTRALTIVLIGITLILAIGCRVKPNYIGEYHMTVTDDMKTMMRTNGGKMRGYDPEAEIQKMEDAASKIVLTIRSNKTYELKTEKETLTGRVEEIAGTLQFTQDGGSSVQEYTFNAEKGTLTTTQSNLRIVYQKVKGDK